ncbi:UbiA prenyltransferase family-domain-containing protein [Infundibulicybe gibba]|nr:UbiA prenyltransferase family-domain-containing protein [Infundibulicybe gibba]
MGRDNTDATPLLGAHEARRVPQPKFPVNIFPSIAHPYLELIRLDKPTGTVLMFWPFAWGLTMAAFAISLPFAQYSVYLGKCLLGAFILRSSACTINDIFDRDMDAGVERTKNRPLASGRISVHSAILFLMVQYFIGILLFNSNLNDLALWVALFQLLPLFAIYPFLKRVTYWPQAWLGFAMNFDQVDHSILFTAMLGCWWYAPYFHGEGWRIYLNSSWTMLYDTVYACQDLKDDVKVGVRSTAILFGSWVRPLLVACGITFVSAFAISGYLNNQGPIYFLISIGGTAVHLMWQFKTVDLDIPQSCWLNFKRNGQLGWIVWAGLMIDYLIKLTRSLN